MTPRPLTLAFCAALAFSCTPLHAQVPEKQPAAPSQAEIEQQLGQMLDAKQVERVAARFDTQKHWPGLQAATARLVELRPHNGHYRYMHAVAHALEDHKTEAYDALVRLQSAGYAYPVEKDPRFSKIHGTEVWDYLVANFQANAKEWGEGKVAYELPADDLLVEALAWDPTRERLLAGSARDGRVYLVGAGGKLEPLVTPDDTNGQWSVLDLAVDAKRDRLWVASAAIPHFKHAKKTDYGRAGVFEYVLSSGRFVARHEVPIDGRQHVLSAIAVTPKGDVFAVDGVEREIWKVDGGKLRFVTANKALTSIRGLAASDKVLYFADYELGVFGLDLASGTPFELAFPQNVTLYSIEGLSYWNGWLVAVQAGFPPKRVMRFKLSPDGRSIVKHLPLEASRAAFGTPTRGTVAGDTYYLIANTQKGKYDAYGLVRSDAKLEPVKILASELDYGFAEAGEKR